MHSPYMITQKSTFNLGFYLVQSKQYVRKYIHSSMAPAILDLSISSQCFTFFAGHTAHLVSMPQNTP